MVGQLTNDNLPSSGKHLRLKADHRLSRNFYKDVKGDAINVLLAAVVSEKVCKPSLSYLCI